MLSLLLHLRDTSNAVATEASAGLGKPPQFSELPESLGHKDPLKISIIRNKQLNHNEIE